LISSRALLHKSNIVYILSTDMLVRVASHCISRQGLH